MHETDLNDVHQIECSIFSLPWSVDDFKGSISDPNNLYLVVEEKEAIIGYCGFWGVVGEGQINNVAVDQSYRGRGVGKLMLEELISRGRGMGLEAFTLEVRVNNKPAIALYHNLGFRDVGIRKNFYESPIEDALIMWL
jgi:ribosomal-protein-alanine N-acetyltransferase